MSNKTYIGHAVYAEIDSYGIKLTTNRDGVTHWIHLEPDVYANLVRYVQRQRDIALGRDGEDAS